MEIEAIIWFLFVVDSLVCNYIAWFKKKGYKAKFKTMSKYLPITKLWAFFYFGFLAWIGYSLYRLGILPF
jgi:hypothetical protein